MKFLVIFFGATLLLSGCTSGSGGEKPDACSLVADESVKNLLGPFTKPDGKSHEGKGGVRYASQCTYRRSESQVSGALDILVRYGEESEAKEDPISAHEASMRNYVGAEYSLERVPDLGDGAGWDGKLNQLTVFKGPHLLILTLPPDTTGENARESAVKLAAEALQRIP